MRNASGMELLCQVSRTETKEKRHHFPLNLSSYTVGDAGRTPGPQSSKQRFRLSAGEYH